MGVLERALKWPAVVCIVGVRRLASNMQMSAVTLDRVAVVVVVVVAGWGPVRRDRGARLAHVRRRRGTRLRSGQIGGGIRD